jgi:hypothetical protein
MRDANLGDCSRSHVARQAIRPHLQVVWNGRCARDGTGPRWPRSGRPVDAIFLEAGRCERVALATGVIGTRFGEGNSNESVIRGVALQARFQLRVRIDRGVRTKALRITAALMAGVAPVRWTSYSKDFLFPVDRRTVRYFERQPRGIR